jgi:hypothetical protein
MFRVSERSNSTFSFVLAATVLASVLPTTWLHWTRDLSDVIRLPITPVAHAGNRLAGWLRPVDSGDGMNEADLRVHLEVLEQDRDRFQRLYRAQRLRSQELAAQLRLLQDLPEGLLRAARPPVILPTDVTARDPGDVVSMVEVKLTPDIEDRVVVGDVATWLNERLVGRVAHRSSFRVTILPLTHPDTGPIQGVVLDAAQEATGAPPARVLLKPLGDGLLAAEVDHRLGTSIGADVVLADPTWPIWAQALHVGSVISVEQIDEAPLRDLIIVQPAVQLHELPHVVLLARDEEPVASVGEDGP